MPRIFLPKAGKVAIIGLTMTVLGRNEVSRCGSLSCDTRLKSLGNIVCASDPSVPQDRFNSID
jgi:hypothetical protein